MTFELDGKEMATLTVGLEELMSTFRRQNKEVPSYVVELYNRIIVRVLG